MNSEQYKLHDISEQFAPAEYAANDFAAVATALAVVDQVVTNPAPVTYSRIRNLFGAAARTLVARTLIDVRDNFTHASPTTQKNVRQDASDLHQQLVYDNIGVRLDFDENQTLIQQAATYGNWEASIPGFTVELKRLGRDVLSRWLKYGISEAPTAAQIAQAKELRALDPIWSAKLEQQIIPMTHVGKTQLIAALRTVATELEA